MYLCSRFSRRYILLKMRQGFRVSFLKSLFMFASEMSQLKIKAF